MDALRNVFRSSTPLQQALSFDSQNNPVHDFLNDIAEWLNPQIELLRFQQGPCKLQPHSSSSGRFYDLCATLLPTETELSRQQLSKPYFVGYQSTVNICTDDSSVRFALL